MNKFIMSVVLGLAMVSSPSFADVKTVAKGWEVTHYGVDKEILEVTNKGNRGGVLTMGCKKPGEDFSLSYSVEGQHVRMFVVELLNNNGIDQYPYLSLYGLGTMSSVGVISQFELSTAGFVMNRYPEGTAEQYLEDRKMGRTGPLNQPMSSGTELFIGHEDIGAYMNEIEVNCKAGDEEKLF